MSVIIGIDPHKATHTVVAIDGDEQPIARLQVVADRCQTERLLGWAAAFGCERTWAIESAGGLGKLLAQQLVGAGEHVVDVPPTLSARVRLLGSTQGRQERQQRCAVDGHRRATALPVAHGRWRGSHRGDPPVDRPLRRPGGVADPGHVPAPCRAARARRRRRTQALSANRANKLLRSVHPAGLVAIERKRLAVDLLADVRRLDQQLAATRSRITDAVEDSKTTLLELHGIGPIVAAYNVGNPARFATPQRFASYNGTAPIEASSGPRKRHRLNPRGNRKLNHAMHLIAVTQIRNDTAGRVYFQRKLAEGKSTKEALRALKRRISDAVWRQLQIDLKPR
jgi:transposase